MAVNPAVAQLADACAARIEDVVAAVATTGATTDATAGAATLEPQFRALLDAVRTLAPQFDFDREGRPGAIAAVRGALPPIERELFDAIIEDHAAEIAANHEATIQIVRAVTRRR